MGARYYDGSAGRFMSEDPAFLAIGDPKRFAEIVERSVGWNIDGDRVGNRAGGAKEKQQL